ncbi:hypothetical protein E2562_014396 [Oryza meyeriana var. granulata]|uniref:Uncharacterized protein n=1 Tax=Oryza meyeriana var. granulata TaxID=110450 RepID=A0A6G1CR48_9ORYZ|nr:hypothetical protein E2562_014396 [Oryza meyeriana var. granulata]
MDHRSNVGVLLGIWGYDSGDRKKNATAATSKMSNGRPIEVIFWNDAPPALSHFSVHGPDLPPAHGDLRLAPKAIAADDDDLILHRVPVNPLPGRKSFFHHNDYFVYHQHQNQTPRLDLFPNLGADHRLRDDDFAIVNCCGDKQ